MSKLYSLLAVALFSTVAFGQVKKVGKDLMISPKFIEGQPYSYQLRLTQLVSDGTNTVTAVDYQTPIQLTLYSAGEGFNLFEWKSQPVLLFKANDAVSSYTFPTNEISIKYRTDENYIMGEVSNYEEMVQEYTLAYQKLYHDETTNYDELASKSSLYFIQLFHLFFGQEFGAKEKMMNLFFNPMKNTFSGAEDEITYAAIDGKNNFNFVQLYNTEMEDNSAKMMNHKTIGSYRSQQTGADYKLKSWGNQSFLADGLIDTIVRVVEVKQDGKTIQFIYTLSPS